ncbi:ComEA family DNA-binding protein [Nocardia sp. alder85J]|uniref:ComEA family DNA-binding protein n=1 Tax=Nocardia sp. alder85J TaxID=2862949 RepID=UPI001CD7484B|nr:helix-hairpin-helix domain-containing protein [Nocardia sp. alder85J]MCX4097479.1 helix-hairpin-helix domain-containing protein [Nocardia sp. alder85J]
MGREDERRRVRERLDALEAAKFGSGPRPVPGGRWDQEEFGTAEPDAVPHGARWDEVEAPHTPPWLSEPVGSMSLWHRRLVPERFRGLRLDPGRRGVLVLGALAVAAVVVAMASTQPETTVAHPVPPIPAARTLTVTPTAPPVHLAETPRTRPAELVISVVGQVEHPGLLHMPSGSRVADAVSAAVAKDGADLATLNLAQRLADGDQVVVGLPGPTSGPARPGSVVLSAHPPGPARTLGTSGPATPVMRVDLNTATEADLDDLPGVGPATARAILAWRTDHGRFSSVDQLAEVAGIGPSKLERLRALVTV